MTHSASHTPLRVDLHVQRLAGRGAAGTPLVLVHGFTGSSGDFADLVPHLGARRPVLAVDLVGHGLSPAPVDPAAYSMASAVASVRSAVAGAGAPRAYYVGYSMGGRVALSLAVEAPQTVDRLVLIGASPGIDDAAARASRVAADEELAELVEREGLGPFVERWLATPLFGTQRRLGAEHMSRARLHRLANRPHALALTLRMLGTGAMPPLHDRLAALGMPVLLVTGELDAKFTDIAREMALRLPSATHVIVPGAGHAVHVEAPEEVGRAIRSFLDGAEAV